MVNSDLFPTDTELLNMTELNDAFKRISMPNSALIKTRFKNEIKTKNINRHQ